MILFIVTERYGDGWRAWAPDLNRIEPLAFTAWDFRQERAVRRVQRYAKSWLLKWRIWSCKKMLMAWHLIRAYEDVVSSLLLVADGLPLDLRRLRARDAVKGTQSATPEP